MENKEKLEKIYELYNVKNYIEANKLNEEVLLSEPNNVYAKRYTSLLAPYLQTSHSKEINGKIAKVKWEKLICPKCKSAVAFSSLNEEQKSKIKASEYNNLELKCPYCNTIFVLQKIKANSILWIKIWDVINYNKKTYRTIWYVEYEWKWVEWSYSWKTRYLEWILLWNNNSYLYFSEWEYYDDWIKNEEFEFSSKVTPDFVLKPDFSSGYVEINWEKIRFKESIYVKTTSLYWENSKTYKVWEDVELYYFSYNWNKYVIEKEWAWRQAEAWIYLSSMVSKSLSATYFWKTITYNNIFNFSNNPWIIWFLVLLIWPVFSFLIFLPVFNIFLESKQKVSIEQIKEWKKYEINFKHQDLMSEKETSITKYDYGGTRIYYSRDVWLRFSVLSEEDKKVVDDINLLWNEKENSDIGKMFLWDIYKLK